MRQRARTRPAVAVTVVVVGAGCAIGSGPDGPARDDPGFGRGTASREEVEKLTRAAQARLNLLSQPTIVAEQHADCLAAHPR
jgi:hypothetical protein